MKSRMKNKMKIAVIGYAGSGKSTLARSLGELYEVPVLHLDTLQFLPNWVVRPPEEMRLEVGKFLKNHDDWVIDGNYSRAHHDQRMKEADQIFILKFNRFSSLWRAFRRSRQYRGRSRPDMAEGCEEKLDWEFTKWILYGGRTQKTREQYRQIQEQYKDKVVVLRNQKEINDYLHKLKSL